MTVRELVAELDAIEAEAQRQDGSHTLWVNGRPSGRSDAPGVAVGLRSAVAHLRQKFPVLAREIDEQERARRAKGSR